MARQGLTEKQEHFCLYYVDCDGNASEAYRMAYDTSNMKNETIWSNACRMLANNKVAARIEKIKAQRAEESKVSREKVEGVLMDIVMADPNDLYTIDPRSGKIRMKSPNQLPKKARNALKKIQNRRGEVTYEFNGKTEAAKLLASMNGWEAPKQVTLSGNDKSVSELRIGFDDEE